MNPQKQKTQFEQIIELVFKYRLAISLVFGAIVLLIIVFTVSNYIGSANNEKANKLYDTAQNYLSYINSPALATNETERLAIYNRQIQSLESLVQLYPKTTASIRARLLLGRVFYNDFFQSSKIESIDKAQNYYNSAYLAAGSDFYKTLALLGRAQCLEQGNKYDKAFEDYNTIVQKYTNQGFAPLALVGMARCREQLSDVEKALNYYNRLIKEYPASEWIRFAKGKIYYYANAAKKNSSSSNAVVPFILPQQ